MIDLLLVAPHVVPGFDLDAQRIMRRVEGLTRWRGATLLSPHAASGPLLTTGARHLDVRIPAGASWDQRLKATLQALQVELVRFRPRLVHTFDLNLIPPVLEHGWRGMQVVVEPGFTAATRLTEAEALLSRPHLVELGAHEDRLLAQAHAVVARSATEASALFRRGVPRKRLWTLPDGPLPAPEAPLPDLPHLAYVGEVDNKSGWSILLAALPLVAASWRLTAFVGEGRARAEAQVQAHRLNDRITFARIDDELAQRLTTARLVVCPARAVMALRTGAWVPEGLAWARSVGRPVLAPNLTVVEEAAGPGFVGFSPDDPQALATALDRLLTRPAEVKALAQAAATHRQTWSWTGTDQALRALWTKMLG